MHDSAAVEVLKSLLLREVEVFCAAHSQLWSAGNSILDSLRQKSTGVVLFGGALRSLLWSRLVRRSLGRPRDLDVVVHGISLDDLRELLSQFVDRETRFGGLHLTRCEWLYDVWPLARTWGVVQDDVQSPSFDYLPKTTFLNLEAVAVDVWPDRSGRRNVYSGDDQFFHGFLTRTIEINREANPYPLLCVVRSLIMAHGLGFRVGGRLARYIVTHGPDATEAEIEDVQVKHYGAVRVAGPELRSWVRAVSRQVATQCVQGRETFPVVASGDCSDELTGYDYMPVVRRWLRRSPRFVRAG